VCDLSRLQNSPFGKFLKLFLPTAHKRKKQTNYKRGRDRGSGKEEGNGLSLPEAYIMIGVNISRIRLWGRDFDDRLVHA